MKIVTETGSVYELDIRNKQARRLVGVNSPTARVGTEGVWKRYEKLLIVKASDGNAVVIDWTGLGNGTMTSRVMKLVTDEELIIEKPRACWLLDALEASVMCSEASIVEVLS